MTKMCSERIGFNWSPHLSQKNALKIVWLISIIVDTKEIITITKFIEKIDLEKPYLDQN